MIWDEPDAGRDVAHAECVRATLARWSARGHTFPMRIEHRLFGGRIGEWTDYEVDETGLWMRGALSRDPVILTLYSQRIAVGELRGLSPGFKTRKYRHESNLRHLDEIDLFEVSVVRYPLHHKAVIHGVQAVAA